MADLPIAKECRDHLENYGITTEVISKKWILDTRDNDIVPLMGRMLNRDITSVSSTTEYCSGTGKTLLFLSNRNIVEVQQIELVRSADIYGVINTNSVELIADEGTLKAISQPSEYYYYPLFPKGHKNIKITYTYGSILSEALKMATKKLVCNSMLELIEGMTGGGALGVQGFNRNYGNTGRYHNIRHALVKRAVELMKGEGMTGVVAS